MGGMGQIPVETSIYDLIAHRTWCVVWHARVRLDDLTAMSLPGSADLFACSILLWKAMLASTVAFGLCDEWLTFSWNASFDEDCMSIVI
jgi:hypothetical protein